MRHSTRRFGDVMILAFGWEGNHAVCAICSAKPLSPRRQPALS